MEEKEIIKKALEKENEVLKENMNKVVEQKKVLEEKLKNKEEESKRLQEQLDSILYSRTYKFAKKLSSLIKR